METKFNEFKEEILKRAKVVRACEDEYKRAYKSETFAELMRVIKDNFGWCCCWKVIDPELIEQYESIFDENEIFCNMSTNKGYLLVTGNSQVEAFDNSQVKAFDISKVKAFDISKVKAFDISKVIARDNSKVEAFENSHVRALDNSQVEAFHSSTVKAFDNSQITATDFTYIVSDSILDCKLSKNAIHRIFETNTIVFASDYINFRKIKSESHE